MRPPETNTNWIDALGTAHIARVIPLPRTISPETRKFMTEEFVPGQVGPKGPPPQQNEPGLFEFKRNRGLLPTRV